MKMRKCCTRLAALALSAVLLTALVLPYPVLAADPSTIVIRSAEELADFSRSCALDTWSQGKTVVLAADIDLSGTDFTPVPTFGGTFDGGGHTVSGLALSEGTSYQGLFRYIQEGGVVRGLHVEGTVAAKGEQAYLGGIAGSNEGTILNCSFRGTVTGKEQAGGIAGINESTGSIYGCTASGTVAGESATGGIAGQNSGTITQCINQSAVNTVHQESEFNLEDGLDGLNREDVLDTTTDTGGIAGYSNGVLQSCRNEGDVGYPHVGYNVGGIAGRSSGYLDGCTNSGMVQGRRDVGGVIGQMTPNVRLIFRQDTISRLQSELDRLNAMVNDTLDHAGDSKDTLSARLDQLSNYAHDASDHVSSLSDILGDWADGSIDTINDAADTLADTLGRLEQITDGGGDILDDMADGIDGLEDSLGGIADAMGIGGDGLDDMAEMVQLARNAIQQARTGLEQIRQALRNLSGALVVEDQEAVNRALELLEAGTEQLSGGLGQCGQALGAIAELLRIADSSDPEVREYLAEYLALFSEGCASAAKAAAQIGQGIALGLKGTSLDWGVIKDCAKEIAAELSGFSGAFDTLDRAIKALQDAFSGFADMAGGMQDGLDGFADGMDIFEGAARDMADVIDEIHNLFEDLARRDPIEFDKLGDDFHQAEDGLHNSVTGIGDQLGLLREEAESSGDTLSSDIRALGDQFQVIAGLLIDALNDSRDKETGDLWDDVSEEQINSTTLGKAKGCSNTGPVEGDLHVGGIAGSMAIESNFDPEEDITEVGEKSFNFLYETRAILQSCVNRGAVTSKKNAAGGIVGNMILGYLLNCENYGSVESTSGNYTGGIAGTSGSTIRGCWSKCTLTGGNYVGGIAGYGSEIYQCVSLIHVDEADGYAGSVVGDWDRTAGMLRGNRFVENPLAGVDGVSYSGRAEPVAYEKLLQEDDVPEDFYQLTMTYVVDDDVLTSVHFSYGDDLSSHTAPPVPEKEGYFGVWQDPGEIHITYDHILEAVYTPYTTTLASTSMRDEIHSVFLVEGVFDSAAVMQAEQIPGQETGEVWNVALTGANDAETHCVRFMPPAEWEQVSLYLLTDQGQTAVSAEQDGSYLVFEADGTSFTLQAVRRAQSSVVLYGVLLAGAAILAAGCVIWRKKKRRAGGKPKKSDAGKSAKALQAEKPAEKK